MWQNYKKSMKNYDMETKSFRKCSQNTKMHFYLMKMQKQPPNTPISLINVNEIVFFNYDGGVFGFLYLPLHPQNERNGALAQLVEHRTENPCVPGSIPGGTTPPFISPVIGFGQRRVFLCP